jgi:hypothetical protein
MVPMPTRVGDVVITHVISTRSSYLVWLAVNDAQQEPRDVAAETTELIDAIIAARDLAKMTHGAVFLREHGSGLWIPIEGPPAT